MSIFGHKKQFEDYFSHNNSKEIGYNVLNATESDILISNNIENSQNIYIINTHINISNLICHKNNIKDNDVVQIPNSAGGNCFFKAISQFYNKTEIYHIYYRYKICKLIQSKRHIDFIKYPYIYGNNNAWLTYEQNFNNIIHTGGFVGEYEIINTCIAFRYNICIYKYSEDKKEYIPNYLI